MPTHFYRITWSSTYTVMGIHVSAALLTCITASIGTIGAYKHENFLSTSKHIALILEMVKSNSILEKLLLGAGL